MLRLALLAYANCLRARPVEYSSLWRLAFWGAYFRHHLAAALEQISRLHAPACRNDSMLHRIAIQGVVQEGEQYGEDACNRRSGAGLPLETFFFWTDVLSSEDDCTDLTFVSSSVDAAG